MKTNILILLLITSSLVYSKNLNIDKPQKGNWNLKVEKVLEINTYGKREMAMPSIADVHENGNIVIYDYRLRENFLFAKDGQYISSFGKKGEGPGEVKRQIRLFSVSDYFLIAGINKLHYFSNKGIYKKTVPIQRRSGKPVFFINENEFISYNSGNKFKVNRINLKNKTKKTIIEESASEEEVNLGNQKFRIVMVIPPLTPKTVFTFDPKTELSYFGRNDKYEIRVMNSSGKVINTFALDRKKIRLTKKMKKALNKEMPISKKMWKKFPKSLTFFSKIKIIDNLLYIFVTNFKENHKEQAIDIFSLNGDYLYSAIFKADKNELINENIFLNKNYIYATIQKEDGDMKVVKYRINLPK